MDLGSQLPPWVSEGHAAATVRLFAGATTKTRNLAVEWLGVLRPIVSDLAARDER